MVNIPLLTYFAFLFLGILYYNIQSKNITNAFGSDFAITIATIQLAFEVIYSIFLWIAPDARKPPKITIVDFIKMMPIGVYSAGYHAAFIFSIAFGGVTFSQIMFATEPLFDIIIATLFYGSRKGNFGAKWGFLIPIIVGVCLVVAKQNNNGSFELSINIKGLIAASIANCFASFKANESKKLMVTTPSIKERIGSDGNQFAIVVIIALFATIPFAFFNEAHRVEEFVNYFQKSTTIYQSVILSCLAFCGYNQVVIVTLAKSSPFIKSIANVLQKVVVIVGSIYVFNESLSRLQVIGCIVCIAGVFIESIADNAIRANSLAHGKMDY